MSEWEHEDAFQRMLANARRLHRERHDASVAATARVVDRMRASRISAASAEAATALVKAAESDRDARIAMYQTGSMFGPANGNGVQRFLRHRWNQKLQNMREDSMKHSKAHPGFKAVQSSIAAREGVSKQR